MGLLDAVFGSGVPFTAAGRIAVRTDKPLYFGGEVVTGHVHLELREATKANSVTIRIKGFEKCEWAERRTVHEGDGKTHTVVDHHHGKHEFFRASVPLATYPMQIAAGSYAFPFSFQLPADLPSSFFEEGSDYKARIAYKFKGVVDVPGMLKPDIKSTQQVLVRQRFAQAITQQRRVLETELRVCCCIGRGRVKARAARPARRGARGQAAGGDVGGQDGLHAGRAREHLRQDRQHEQGGPAADQGQPAARAAAAEQPRPHAPAARGGGAPGARRDGDPRRPARQGALLRPAAAARPAALRQRPPRRPRVLHRRRARRRGPRGERALHPPRRDLRPAARHLGHVLGPPAAPRPHAPARTRPSPGGRHGRAVGGLWAPRGALEPPGAPSPASAGIPVPPSAAAAGLPLPPSSPAAGIPLPPSSPAAGIPLPPSARIPVPPSAAATRLPVPPSTVAARIRVRAAAPWPGPAAADGAGAGPVCACGASGAGAAAGHGGDVYVRRASAPRRSSASTSRDSRRGEAAFLPGCMVASRCARPRSPLAFMLPNIRLPKFYALALPVGRLELGN